MSSANAARTEAAPGSSADELSARAAHAHTGTRAHGRTLPSAEAAAYAGLSLATLCWASAFIAGKVALAEMSPIVVGAWRYAIASLVLLPFALRSRRLASLRGVGFPFAIMVVTGGLLYPLLFLVALQNTSATNTSLLIALNPAFTTLLSPLIGACWRA